MKIVICYFDTINIISAGIWTGWTDDRIEGTYTDPASGEILDMNTSFAPFNTGEPNGDEAENCIVSDPKGIWWDVPCSDVMIGSCLLKQMPLQFKLRGNIYFVRVLH